MTTTPAETAAPAPELYPPDPPLEFVGWRVLLDQPDITNGINQHLTYQGYPPLTGSTAARSDGGAGSTTVRYGRLIVDGGGAGSGSANDTERFHVAGGLGIGGLSFGWLLFERFGLRVYPLVGVGGAGVGVEVRPGEIASSSAQGYTLSAGAPAFQVALGVDWVLKFWRIRVAVGVRVGWRFPRTPITPDPHGPKLGGPYFYVQTGGGLGRK